MGLKTKDQNSLQSFELQRTIATLASALYRYTLDCITLWPEVIM